MKQISGSENNVACLRRSQRQYGIALAVSLSCFAVVSLAAALPLWQRVCMKVAFISLIATAYFLVSLVRAMIVTRRVQQGKAANVACTCPEWVTLLFLVVVTVGAIYIE